MVFKIFMNVAVHISNGNGIDGQRAKVTLYQGNTVGSQFLSQKILDINLGMKIIVLLFFHVLILKYTCRIFSHFSDDSGNS